MELTFYTCALVAILATLRVVTNSNPVHALLYLVVSLLAVAGVFFALGAPFAGGRRWLVSSSAPCSSSAFGAAASTFSRTPLSLPSIARLSVRPGSAASLAGISAVVSRIHTRLESYGLRTDCA